MKLLLGGGTAAILLTKLVFALASESQIPLQQHVTTVQQSTIGSHNWTDTLLTLHKDLISIESVSGHEHAIGQYISSYLSAQNFTIKTQGVPPLEQNPHKSERFNVYAYNGRSPKANVLVTSHMDTVPPFYNYTSKPGNDIWGRGSVDDKGALAAQIVATLSLLEEGKIGRGDVGLLFVVGEEVDGGGMKRANDLNLHWKAGIFGEPTELKLADGHKGVQALILRAEGKAAHSGYPWLGVDANRKLIKALAILEDLDLGQSEKYGNTTINIGRIDAGVAGNVVSASAKADIQIRLAVGPAKEIQKKISDAIGSEVELDWRLGYPPIDLDHDVEGFETITVNYGTDVPWLQKDRVQKRYLFGPGTIFVAHSDHEHLSAKDLEDAVEGYRKLILHALKA